jgi:hypothetical protein
MTASLFGALAALALSAGATLSALLEVAASDRDRVWRAIAWGGLVPGWIIFATMLLHAPLSHLDVLRVLATGFWPVALRCAHGVGAQSWGPPVPAASSPRPLR